MNFGPPERLLSRLMLLGAGPSGAGGGEAGARTLYYDNAEADDAWETLGNWWNDSGHTDPALSLPGALDTVHIAGSLAAPVAPVEVAAVIVDSGSVDLLGVTAGSFTVNGTSEVGGITGDVEFNDTAVNQATVTGNATFNDSASNASSVTGNAVFNGSSSNGGSVSGNAEFRDSSNNDIGTVGGTADVYSPVVYPLGGTVNGTITYHGYPMGCTDPGATNYDPAAVIDDGNCVYA